jgi:hypothetical protein
MLKHIRIGFAIFVVSLLGMELLSGLFNQARWLVGKWAWGPAMSLQTAPDVFPPLLGVLPVFLLIPFLYLLIVGLIALFELN